MTAVLITGCSSGIGRASALRLASHRDLTVYATARKPDQLADLADAGCRTLALDVTDEASMAEAVTTVEKEHGAVGVLVNNAGFGEFGTVEEASLDRVRAQFETNFFGAARLTQLVLPAMRAAGRGRIVNVSSMGGRMTLPGGGYYHASKYALEALSDALRFEVARFGISVSIVEPGLVRTSFTDTAAHTLAQSTTPDSSYRPLLRRIDAQVAQSYRNRLLSAGPEPTARAVERAVRSRRPRTRYLISAPAKLLVHTRRLFGARVFDTYLRTQFGTS